MLECTSLMSIAIFIIDIGFNLQSMHLGLDGLLQVTALLSAPLKFKGTLSRYYVSINMYLYELANMTNQKEEDIFFWFDQ